MRYATTTGTVLIRWDGARAPDVWTVPRPAIEPLEARRELARRYLHVFGPGTHASFATWAGVGAKEARVAWDGLELTPVTTPIGEASILSADEALMREPAEPSTAVRLLPSGDAYWLHHDAAHRELLVPDAKERGGALDAARLAGSAPRRGRDRRDVAARAGRPLDRAVAHAHESRARGGRGGGGVAAAARSRRAGLGALARVGSRA